MIPKPSFPSLRGPALRMAIAGCAAAMACAGSISARSATSAAPALAEVSAVGPVAPSGLTPDQIYAVLVGEIAGRRGRFGTAFVHYLRAAELTRSAQMAELAVRVAISGEDDEAAGHGIRLWLELAPTAPAAHQIAAFLRIKAGDREGGLIHLVRLVELSGDSPAPAYAQAAAIISRLSSAETRVALMQALVGRYPESADAQQALAILAGSASNFDVAAKAARRAMELRPAWNVPQLFLVRLALTEGKRDDARRLLEGFVNQAPDDHALRMLYGQFLVEEREFSSARDVFERLLRNRPKEPDVLFAAGVLALQLDDPSGARDHFRRLFETGARQDEAAYYLGQVEERADNVKQALVWYAKVKGANERDAQVRTALLRAKSGEVVQAREILQQLRGKSPDDAVSLYLVEAEILDEIDRPADAMAVYDGAMKSYADDGNLRYARALYAVKVGQIDLAERDLQQLIAAEPDHADALNALGYTLADRTGRFQEALGFIERAYALKPDEPAILDSMGWVNYRLGNYEAAREFLSRALAKMNDGEIAAHLGEVLWALDRKAEAWSVWDKALSEHPEHQYLLEVTARHRISKATAGDKGAAQKQTVGGAP